MYDNDDDHDGSGGGLGGMVWYQLGRWAAEDDIKQRHFADALRARFTPAQRPQGRIYIDDYNKLINERDAWCKHARKLENEIQKWETAFLDLREDRDFFENKTVKLRDELKETSERLHNEILDLKDEAKAERRRADQNETNERFMYQRFLDLADFALHGLATEPEFRELVVRTGEFREELAKFRRNERKYPLDLQERVNELTKILTEKRQARKR